MAAWVLVVAASSPATGQAGGVPCLEVVRADQAGVALVLTTPSRALGPLMAGATAAGATAGRVSAPDGTEVPTVTGLVAFPPGTTLVWSVGGGAAAAQDMGLPPTAADGWFPAVAGQVDAPVAYRGWRLARFELYPVQRHAAHGTLRVRPRLKLDVRFAPLDPATAYVPEAAPATAVVEPLEPTLRRLVVNAASASGWMAPRPGAAPGSGAGVAQAVAGPRLKVEVAADGLYRLDARDLERAGLDPPALDPRRLVMTNQGRPVAIQVVGEEDGRLDAGDHVLFYGRQPRGPFSVTRYTAANVYWLSEGSAAGPRMAVLDGTPASGLAPQAVHRAHAAAKEHRLWWAWHSMEPRFVGEDVWFWSRLQPAAGASATEAFTVTLTGIAPSGNAALVRGEVVSRSPRPDHRLRAHWGASAEPFYTGSWDGKARHAFEGLVPAPALREGENVLRLTLDNAHAAAPDDVYVDRFEVSYDRTYAARGGELAWTEPGGGRHAVAVTGFDSPDVAVYDVTDPWLPVAVTGLDVERAGGAYLALFEAVAPGAAEYLAVTVAAVRAPTSVRPRRDPDLLAPAEGADYIVVAHRDLMGGARRLADYRAAQGLRARVVDIEAVYDTFNHGLVHPHAIRDFLAHAYAHWPPPAPTFAVLVGDGHWNFHAYPAYPAPPVLMPPNMEWVDPWQGEVDSTNRLAVLVGPGNLPDLSIGRLLADDEAELQSLLDKLEAYERAPAAPWQRQHIVVADDPDATADFDGIARGIAHRHLPPDHDVLHIGLDEIKRSGGCGSPEPGRDCPAANTAIVEALNGPGGLTLAYFGHAASWRWAHEQILVPPDLPRLTNEARQPLVLSFACLDGAWCRPDSDSLMEQLVSRPAAGAIAAFTTTGLGQDSMGQRELWAGVYDALFLDGLRQLGPVTDAAKLALYTAYGSAFLIDTYLVMGDPALRVPVPEPATATPQPSPSPTATGTPAAAVFLPAVARRP